MLIQTIQVICFIAPFLACSWVSSLVCLYIGQLLSPLKNLVLCQVHHVDVAFLSSSLGLDGHKDIFAWCVLSLLKSRFPIINFVYFFPGLGENAAADKKFPHIKAEGSSHRVRNSVCE